MKNKTKKIIAILAILSLVGLGTIANAMENDVRCVQRNGDDTEDVIIGIPTRATSSPSVLGGAINGSGCVWYYFSSNFTSTIQSNEPYAGQKVTLAIDPNTINIFDLTGGPSGVSDLFDSKVSLTTFNSAIATVTAMFNTFPTSSIQIQSDWNQASTTLKDFIKNKPIIPAAQIQSDWNQASTTLPDYIKNKPETSSKAYEGTTQRTGAFPVFKSATVGSGVAVFYLTTDGTSGGTSLFPNGVISDSIDVEVNDALASYQMSYVLSNGNKTLTVTTNKLTTANILTGILGQSSANGSVVRLVVWGY